MIILAIQYAMVIYKTANYIMFLSISLLIPENQGLQGLRTALPWFSPGTVSTYKTSNLLKLISNFYMNRVSINHNFFTPSWNHSKLLNGQIQSEQCFSSLMTCYIVWVRNSSRPRQYDAQKRGFPNRMDINWIGCYTTARREIQRIAGCLTTSKHTEDVDRHHPIPCHLIYPCTERHNVSAFISLLSSIPSSTHCCVHIIIVAILIRSDDTMI